MVGEHKIEILFADFPSNSENSFFEISQENG